MIEIAELREVVSQLSAPERAGLAEFLLSGLEDTHYGVSDEEVLERQTELSSGEVQGLSLEGFREACGR